MNFFQACGEIKYVRMAGDETQPARWVWSVVLQGITKGVVKVCLYQLINGSLSLSLSLQVCFCGVH